MAIDKPAPRAQLRATLPPDIHDALGRAAVAERLPVSRTLERLLREAFEARDRAAAARHEPMRAAS